MCPASSLLFLCVSECTPEFRNSFTNSLSSGTMNYCWSWWRVTEICLLRYSTNLWSQQYPAFLGVWLVSLPVLGVCSDTMCLVNSTVYGTLLLADIVLSTGVSLQRVFYLDPETSHTNVQSIMFWATALASFYCFLVLVSLFLYIYFPKLRRFWFRDRRR
jgi:hypothetical protein